MSEEEGKHSDALEILRQYVQRYSDFFLVCLTGTLGFQQEESYSNRFLREQKHRSGFGCVNRKVMANGTDSAELQVCYSATVQDMLLERQCLAKNDTEAANRWRKRNTDLIDLHRRTERRMVVKLFWCSEHKFHLVIIEL